MKVISYIETNFNKLFWFLSAVVFVLIALRAFCIPFSHDEAATFFFYVQSDNYLPYHAHIYTNNHVLNSALTNLCYHLLGSHRFGLRLPNIFSFLLLCLGVFKHFKYLKSIYSKLILITFFLLTINFLDFFELCRGYGLSFGFIVLGFSYLMDYFREKKIRSFSLFSIFLQLALAANLILVVLLVILIFYVFVFQIKNKLFNAGTIITQLINVALLIFWIKFSFFYKEHGSLDYGVGENYWEVTFKTLMLFLFSTNEAWLQFLLIIGFISLVFFSGNYFFKKPVSLNTFFTPQVFYTLMLATLIVAFYAEKIILSVGLPEDRTGVFFYLLFVLGLAFAMDVIPQKISGIITLSLFTPSLLFFIITYNTHDFSSWFYHTIPKSSYDILVDEFKTKNQIITIGGHRVREMDYAFLNYRGSSVLNDMDNAEQMTMNCDYYIAMQRERPYYKYFYDEIELDKTWDRALLKRKEKIKRNDFYKLSETPKSYKGQGEFFEFFRLPDTSLKTRNCIEMELDITFNKVPKPVQSNIILQVNDKKGEQIYYKRIPLNWLADDLNGQTKHLKLTSGPLPDSADVLVVYMWNIKQVEMDFTINELKILELKGKGVNVVIPKSFYNYLDTKPGHKSLL